MYTVKYWNGIDIINDLVTNDEVEAMERESELKVKYGLDAAWIANTLTEILVG